VAVADRALAQTLRPGRSDVVLVELADDPRLHDQHEFAEGEDTNARMGRLASKKRSTAQA
jgi:hypothetical protein